MTGLAPMACAVAPVSPWARTYRWAGTVLAGALLAASCGENGAATLDAESGTVPDTSARVLGGTFPQIMLDMEGAHERTAFRGTRVFQSYLRTSEIGTARTQPTAERYELEEVVAGDGDGRYAIELVDAIELPGGVNDLLFPTTYERGVDAQWSLREFRVHDVDLLYQNYSVTLPGPGATVAGIACDRVVLQRFEPFPERPGHYQLDVDPASGFVLALTEFDDAGAVLEEYEYQTFEIDPDLSDLSLRSSVFAGVELDVSLPLETQVNTLTLVPSLWPDGFELLRAKTFSVPQSIEATGSSLLPPGQWVRMYATDGVEIVAFAHATTDAPQANPVAPAKLQVLEEGGWTVGFGRVRGVPLVVSGRVGPGPLRFVVESAF